MNRPAVVVYAGVLFALVVLVSSSVVFDASYAHPRVFRDVVMITVVVLDRFVHPTVMHRWLPSRTNHDDRTTACKRQIFNRAVSNAFIFTILLDLLFGISESSELIHNGIVAFWIAAVLLLVCTPSHAVPRSIGEQGRDGGIARSPEASEP